MTNTPALDLVIDRIEKDLIGGAADMAKETADALHDAFVRVNAPDARGLRTFAESIFQRVIAATASIAPVTFVLHLVGSELERTTDGVAVEEMRGRLVAASDAAREAIATAVVKIAAFGSESLRDGDRIFTYSTSSTVYAILVAAREAGKRLSLVTTESRPGNEGLRSIEVAERQGIPLVVGIDAAVGVLVRDCDVVLVGADTVTARGDALCKIGSFPLALAARRFGVPFRVVADTSKFDANTLSGVPLLVREMPASDIIASRLSALVEVRNPVFELVPADLIDAVVTERGIIHPAAASGLMSSLPRSEMVSALVRAHYRAGRR